MIFHITLILMTKLKEIKWLIPFLIIIIIIIFVIIKVRENNQNYNPRTTETMREDLIKQKEERDLLEEKLNYYKNFEFEEEIKDKNTLYNIKNEK